MIFKVRTFIKLSTAVAKNDIRENNLRNSKLNSRTLMTAIREIDETSGQQLITLLPFSRFDSEGL